MQSALRSLSTLTLAIVAVFAGHQTTGAQSDLPPSLFIEAYPEKQSVAPGDELQLHTSTSASEYSIEIARLGAERKIVYQKSKIPGGGSHPIPENASSHGCNWPIGFRLTIPNDWKSGYYLATLRVVDSGGKYVGRNRRTAEVDAFFCGAAVGAWQALQDTTATFHEHLQRVHQLGRR